MSAVRPAPSPTKGTWVPGTPSFSTSAEVSRCAGLPLPGEPKLIPPGVARASFCRSARLAMPCPAGTASTSGDVPSTATPSKSRSGS